MTTGHESISAAIRAAKARGEPALVAYLTAGFPSRDSFKQHLQAIAAAADVVEIGVPFTDPMADGVTIQRASHAALAQGVSLRWILAQLETMPRGKTPLLLMSYLNPLLALGLEALAAAAARAGVAGFIVPDLPFDESAEARAALQSARPRAGTNGYTGHPAAASRGDLCEQPGVRVCGDDDRHDGQECRRTA